MLYIEQKMTSNEFNTDLSQLNATDIGHIPALREKKKLIYIS